MVNLPDTYRFNQKIYTLLLFLFLGTFTLLAQEKDRPREGEGMYAFLRRNNRAGADYQKEFLELNKGKFGKNQSLLRGVVYTLPPLKKDATAQPTATKTKLREPLFGKGLEEYEVISDELKGATYYVVSGHGGPDPGAIGKKGKQELHEDEYAYDIALRLARNLMTRGAKVHIIIQDAQDGIRNETILKNNKTETCMGDPIPLRQVERLKQRCVKINELYQKEKPAYARAIFIHIDSRSVHKQLDVFFYHSPSEASKQLAQTMRQTFSDKYRRFQPQRGFSGTVEQRNLYVLKEATPVALYVELGNIQNSADQERIVSVNNRDALANWLYAGFVADYQKSK
ncbi:N-acetylmuramoyl-L-alanine amidase [Parabacteroides sp. PFB2-12]|uniref:N-acetylmuramoyl-L-alanine amidase family protein n=1 Tax=unclassified Parabacteroides TaxID=2649774 RepID=UPI0024772AD7|nr:MULTISPECIES: N-acetylmuramoyl-L-alanine amidase [unclassified Parabacteroides]MDH6343858.1 N-acetylmuramoyl-L-alanine amidase [Parabacteroides sp. PM6-13]MDH6391220.1 N-acetylmuramoyl-L-alanine amidase [Parabacteroides sp. PFB2-12]